jgi:hypothetical protein
MIIFSYKILKLLVMDRMDTDLHCGSTALHITDKKHNQFVMNGLMVNWFSKSDARVKVHLTLQ